MAGARRQAGASALNTDTHAIARFGAPSNAAFFTAPPFAARALPIVLAVAVSTAKPLGELLTLVACVEFTTKSHVAGVADTTFGLGVANTMTGAVEWACARVADGPCPSLEAKAFVRSADTVAAAIGCASG